MTCLVSDCLGIKAKERRLLLPDRRGAWDPGLGDAWQGKHIRPARWKQHGVHHWSAWRRGHAFVAGHHQILHEDCQSRWQVRKFLQNIFAYCFITKTILIGWMKLIFVCNHEVNIWSLLREFPFAEMICWLALNSIEGVIFTIFAILDRLDNTFRNYNLSKFGPQDISNDKSKRI